MVAGQLSRQSRGLKILVSPVRFWVLPPLFFITHQRHRPGILLHIPLNQRLLQNRKFFQQPARESTMEPYLHHFSLRFSVISCLRHVSLIDTRSYLQTTYSKIYFKSNFRFRLNDFSTHTTFIKLTIERQDCSVFELSNETQN